MQVVSDSILMTGRKLYSDHPGKSETWGFIDGKALDTSASRNLLLLRTKKMNKDRIVGSAKQIKGTIEEAAGKILKDAKLVADGKSDKIKGKIQNAVGSVKDSIKK